MGYGNRHGLPEVCNPRRLSISQSPVSASSVGPSPVSMSEPIQAVWRFHENFVPDMFVRHGAFEQFDKIGLMRHALDIRMRPIRSPEHAPPCSFYQCPHGTDRVVIGLSIGDAICATNLD